MDGNQGILSQLESRDFILTDPMLQSGLKDMGINQTGRCSCWNNYGKCSLQDFCPKTCFFFSGLFLYIFFFSVSVGSFNGNPILHK